MTYKFGFCVCALPQQTPGDADGSAEKRKKMKLKKLAAIALAAVMMMSMTACGGNDNGGSSSSTGDSNTGSDDGKTYKVGICQLVQHDALDAATTGFKEALTEKLGDKVTFDRSEERRVGKECRL